MDERDLPLIERDPPVPLSAIDEAWMSFFALLDGNSRLRLRKALVATILKCWNPPGPTFTDHKLVGQIADKIMDYIGGTLD